MRKQIGGCCCQEVSASASLRTVTAERPLQWLVLKGPALGSQKPFSIPSSRVVTLRSRGSGGISCLATRRLSVSLSIPAEALAPLRKVAATRDMSIEAPMRLYISQGLRQDTSRLFSERILETTARVLARHISSEDRAALLREIQGEATA
jgi:hypothetical protein